MSIAWAGLFIVLKVFGDTSMKMNRTSPTLLLYYNAKLGDYKWHKWISMSETKNKAIGLPLGYAPSDSEVQKYLDAWDQLDDYVRQEVALTSLFSNYPNSSRRQRSSLWQLTARRLHRCSEQHIRQSSIISIYQRNFLSSIAIGVVSHQVDITPISFITVSIKIETYMK